MVEIEGSDNSNFLHQTDRVGQTDDTHTISTCIASSYDLKTYSELIKIRIPTVGYIALVWWKSKALIIVILYTRQIE